MSPRLAKELLAKELKQPVVLVVGGIVVTAMVAAAILFFHYSIWSIRVEFVKTVFQFLLVTIAGGVIAFAYRLYEIRRGGAEGFGMEAAGRAETARPPFRRGSERT